MYTVVWADPVLDRLADLYIAATPTARDRMAAGVTALNRRLADRPNDEGESRDEPYRIAFPDLLQVLVRVDLMSDTVSVVAVALYGR